MKKIHFGWGESESSSIVGIHDVHHSIIVLKKIKLWIVQIIYYIYVLLCLNKLVELIIMFFKFVYSVTKVQFRFKTVASGSFLPTL